ncbi:serine/arginine repetitive matrix protein 2 isoform X2 [Culicoides brevitarsis]|uniref:serine/arginine repetitive matrix protein 2 isoform X2 n=1 Tax=Culicoides brevitarsis TaxID=469753 RepID=UPI00307B6981
MYNGIGLQTARGSGTNGHVQRNWAFVRPGKKTNVNYKTEEELEKLNAISSKQPNLEILDHERKRKIEVKCAELEDVLESQGLSENEVREKVKAFRENLVNQVVTENPINSKTGRIEVRETHQIAQAQQEKNARLREAFGISEYFVEGSSFDAERKAKEELAKSEAIQKELQEKNALEFKETGKKYALVRTPSQERDADYKTENDVKKHKSSKRKKKKSSSNTEKKKKSKKHKKEKSKKKSKKSRHDSESSNSASDSESSSESESETERKSKKSKKNKKSKSKKKDTKKRKLSDSCESSSKSDYENGMHKHDSEQSEKNKKHGKTIERHVDSSKKGSSENITISQQEKPRKSRDNEYNSYEKYPKRRSISPKIKLNENSSSVREDSRFRSDRQHSKDISKHYGKNNTYSPKRNSRREDNCSINNKRSRSREERNKKYGRSRSPKKMSSITTNRLNEKSDRRDSFRERSRQRLYKSNDSNDRRRYSPKRLDDRKRSESPSKRRYTKRQESAMRNRSRSPITRHSRRHSRSISREKRKRSRSTDERRKIRSGSQRTRTPTEDRKVRNSNKKRSSSKQPDNYKKDLATIVRKKSISKSSSFSPAKHNVHTIDHCSPKSKKSNRSHSRSLSYSPAQRNPERYRDILHGKTSHRSRKRTSLSPLKRNNSYNKPKPIVKLHPSDDKSSVDSEQDESGNLYDEIPSGSVKTSSELLKLKAQLAAKAKKALEEKKTVEKSPFVPKPTEIMVEEATAISETDYKEEGREKKERARESSVEPNKNKIAIKPFKIHDAVDKIGVPDVFERETVSNVGQQHLKLGSLRDMEKMKPPKCPSPSMEKSQVKDRSPTADTADTNRSSRSTSRHSKTSRDYSSRSRRSHSTRSRSSRSSRSSSRSSSSSSSSSRSSSSSSHHSSRRSRSRSPSIPRRSGSPSFLDRRRITSARKRPIPYHKSKINYSGSISSDGSRSRSR